MAKIEGKIVRLGKGFGFAKMDNGSEWFVHHSAYLGPMVEGDHIRAELDDSNPKGPRAKDVELLSRGSPGSPSSTSASGASPTSSSREIEISWEFGKAVADPNNNTLQILPLTLALKAGKLPKAGVELLLTADGTDVQMPAPNPSTDGLGKAIFLISLAKRSKMCALALTVNDGAKKIYTHVWERREKKSAVHPATPVTEAEKKLPEIEVVNPPRDPDTATGIFLVNVVTRKDGKKTNRDFTAFCDQTIDIKQPSPTGLSAVTAFTPVTTGHYQLYVDFPGIMVKIVFKLSNGNEAAVRLRK